MFLGYKMNNRVEITVKEFKSYFARDFDYGDTLPSILDSDIQKAIDEASITFNFGLYPNPLQSNVMKTALYYLTAHYLLINTYSADTGGQSSFIQSSRSVGGISESVDIPEYMKNKEFSFYGTTFYGQRFIQISMPFLFAGFTVHGNTQVG